MARVVVALQTQAGKVHRERETIEHIPGMRLFHRARQLRFPALAFPPELARLSAHLRAFRLAICALVLCPLVSSHHLQLKKV